MTCESNLRTLWMAKDQAALASGAGAPLQLDMTVDGLVVAVVGQSYNGGWRADQVDVLVKVNGREDLTQDGAAVAGSMFYDDRGPRPLTEPIPLRIKQNIQLTIINRHSAPVDVRATAELVPMDGKEMDRYINDPAYRLAVKEELALAWLRRR